MHEKLVKSSSGPTLRSQAHDPCRLEKFPALFAAVTELQATGLHGQLRRLLRTLEHYETVGVLRGEPPPCADYAGRQHRDSDDAVQVMTDLTEEDALQRSFEPVDVERWVLSAEYPLFLAQMNAAAAAPRAVKQERGGSDVAAAALAAAAAAAPAAAKRTRRPPARSGGTAARAAPPRRLWEHSSDEDSSDEEDADE